MNSIYYQEKLNLIKNEMTHLWGSAFVTGGSIFAFFFNEHTLINVFWGCISFIATVVLLNAYIIRRVETIKILNLIKQEEEK